MAVQGFAFLEVLRQVGLIRQQLEPQQGALIVPDAADTGAPLPELTGRAATTLRPAQWSDYFKTNLNLIVCLTTRCLSCRSIAEELTGLAADVRGDATIVALVEGMSEEVQGFMRETQLDPHLVIVDDNGAMTKRLGVSWNPGVVTVRGGEIGEAAIVNSVQQINALIYGKNMSSGKRRVKNGVPA